MSSNLPPDSTGGPEYLDSQDGVPLQPPPEPSSSGGRRTALVIGGGVGLLAVVGVGAWAAWATFFSTGPQPAQALPASTIAYVSVDLDPSGEQKIEALRTLRKFPAFKDQLDLETDDDIRERIFEEIKPSGCEDLDYGDDIEPWLGDRTGFAVVDTTSDAPTSVVVLQVSDEDAADTGLEKLNGCGEGSAAEWAINDGWALLGEDQEVLDQIAADAAESPLADDDDFTTWTDEAGDPGIMSMYLAPEAGELIADNLDGLVSPDGPVGGLEDGVPLEGLSDTPEEMDELAEALKDFKGAAATLRFDDGALELELAADSGSAQQALIDTDRGDDVMSTLPEDTAAAIGLGFTEGWFGDLVDQIATSLDTGMSPEELMSEMSAQTGLDLPDDLETLTGESAALAISSTFDPATFFNSTDGSDVPVGLKVQGDADEIESVLDKIRPQLGPDEVTYLDSDSDGDMVAIGPDADYRAQLLEDGDLGGSKVFENVVREAGDAAAILFVNFDAGDDWLSKAADDAPEVAENLAPLQGAGLSVWSEDATGHAVLRITTD